MLPLCVAFTACLDESLARQPEINVVPGTPPGWVGTASTLGIGITVSDAYSGTKAAYLSNAFQGTFASYRLVQSVRAEFYRGQRVRLSAWLKPRNVSNVAASGLFMRVDGPGLILQSDEMLRQPVTGVGGWRQVAVVLDVPERAIGITFGALFQASNTLLVDELRLEVVGADVRSSNTIFTPVSSGLDSLATEQVYARSPDRPLNLDFEGLASVAGTPAAWLARNAIPLAGTDPDASLSDLEPLDALVGDATIVGLGEGSYGTREFQQLKHRMLRRLVSAQHFSTLALDAPAAEVDALDAYVRGAEGDLPRLLSRLSQWTLNTQEFSAAIGWLRQWNGSVAESRRVRVIGLDVLSPGASMDSVVSFVRRVAPTFEADIVFWYKCLDLFRNRGSTPGRPRSEYASLPNDVRALCAEGINDALNVVRERGVGAAGYDHAVRDARLVKQFEAVAGASNATNAVRARERALAENVLAVAERFGAAARTVVWSHNDRVTRQDGTMGAWLQDAVQDRYRPIAFTFGSGRFTAQLQQGATSGATQSFDVQVIPSGSFEEAALATNGPQLMLDTRRIPGGGLDAAPLAGPIAMRTIGLTFNPNTESSYFPVRRFPSDFDVVVFVRATTATTLLPFVN